MGGCGLYFLFVHFSCEDLLCEIIQFLRRKKRRPNERKDMSSKKTRGFQSSDSCLTRRIMHGILAWDGRRRTGTGRDHLAEISFRSEPAIFYLGTHENPRPPKGSAGPCHETSISENFICARLIRILMASEDPKLSIPGFLGMVRSRFSSVGATKGTQLVPSSSQAHRPQPLNLYNNSTRTGETRETANAAHMRLAASPDAPICVC
jgi:hypothetical protein